MSELISCFSVFTSELRVKLWKATLSLPSQLVLRIRLHWPLHHHLLLLPPWPVLLPLTCPLQIQLLCPLPPHYLLGSSWLQPYPRCLRSQHQCLTWQLHPWQRLPWRMPSLRSNLDFSSSRRSKFSCHLPPSILPSLAVPSAPLLRAAVLHFCSPNEKPV